MTGLDERAQLQLLRFQFLIGKLVTKLPGLAGGDEPEFQFLIGKLVTRPPARPRTPRSWFQFLIGKLVTRIPHKRGADGKFGFNSS